MTPLAILRGARELLSVPERWTQGEHARGKRGGVVDPLGRHATCWCAQGALMRASASQEGFHAAVRTLETAIARGDLTMWNDAPERTHAEILQALDQAIALATAREEGAP